MNDGFNNIAIHTNCPADLIFSYWRYVTIQTRSPRGKPFEIELKEECSSESSEKLQTVVTFPVRWSFVTHNLQSYLGWTETCF